MQDKQHPTRVLAKFIFRFEQFRALLTLKRFDVRAAVNCGQVYLHGALPGKMPRADVTLEGLEVKAMNCRQMYRQVDLRIQYIGANPALKGPDTVYNPSVFAHAVVRCKIPAANLTYVIGASSLVLWKYLRSHIALRQAASSITSLIEEGGF